MNKRLQLIFLFFSIGIASFAQGTVSGTVTDDGGDPLPGVNVLVMGTSSGSVTGIDGTYTVNVPDNGTLVFSFVGYVSQEINVAGRSEIDVVLDVDVQQLAEVVVIGYGQTTIQDATGAVAAVSSDEFNQGMISSPEQLIQGKTAGVQITSTSGNPGAGVQLRIRGTTSIRSNNNPLFVVDGVPLSGGTQPSPPDVGFGTTDDTNPLSFINPNDIESISILKDASATAIYGSRGANGVVIITTKSGKGSQGSFDFSSSVSVASPANSYELLDRDEYLDAIAQFGGDPEALDGGADTDWQDFVTRTSVSNKHNLSYSKGLETGSVRASLGYENLQGIMENSYLKRLTGRVNASKSLFNDKVNIDLSATFSNLNREDPAISSSAGAGGDILGAAYSANPTWPADPDFNTAAVRSPANMLEYYRSEGTTNRMLTNVSVDYKLTNSLIAKATYGLDWSKGNRVTLVSGNASNVGDGVTGSGLGQLNENKTLSNLLELTLNYQKKVGKVNIDVVAGYSVQSFQNKYHYATGRGFTDYESFDAMEDELKDSFDAADAIASGFYEDPNNWGVSNDLRDGDQLTGGFVSGIDYQLDTLTNSYFPRPGGVTVNAIASNFYDQTDYLQSYFGRGNFTISDKYLLTATLRIDGSSKFGSDNRYGVFPSGAVAWKISEEDFMSDAFSTFKLRAGYGIVGNQDGLGYGNFIRRDRYSDASIGTASQITVPAPAPQGFANPGLKWEQTSQTSIGIDFGIMNERLSGSVDWYLKRTKDLLLKTNTAQPAVAPQIFDNLDAIVENKGWEVALNYVAVDNPDASFSIGGNVSHNTNLVKDFAGVLDAGTIYGQGLTNAYAQRLAGGHPLFSYYLRQFEGFDDNGQPIGDEQVFIGKSALPIWNAGLSLNARYKAFDLSMYFSGQFDFYVYNNTKNAFFTAGSIQVSRNVTKDVLTSGESGSAEAAVSTRFLERGDFVRMQNLTLGYNVQMGSEGAIKKLRFYLNAQNIFLITGYSGLDPEVSTSPADSGLLSGLPTAGIDYTSYPRPRVFTLGLIAAF